jgi:hypothetical protein
MKNATYVKNSPRGNRRAMWRFNKTNPQRGPQEETT